MKWEKVSDDPRFNNVLQSDDNEHLLIKAISKTKNWFSSSTDESYLVIDLGEKTKKIGFGQ